MESAKEKAIREEGFYWVNWGDNWQVAEWNGFCWGIAGVDVESFFMDKHMSEIDERKLVRLIY